jgi:hypothetical protein
MDVLLLEENAVSPKRLINALEAYLTTLDQYLEIKEIQKQETDLLLSNEMKEAVQPFLNLLKFIYLLSETSKKSKE